MAMRPKGDVDGVVTQEENVKTTRSVLMYRATISSVQGKESAADWPGSKLYLRRGWLKVNRDEHRAFFTG
jgi:Zn-dependent M28 family amino/carboxypeptidase